MKNNLTKEDVLRIPKLRAAGKTNAEIGKELGVTKSAIDYWVRRFRNAGRPLPTPKNAGRKAIEI